MTLTQPSPPPIPSPQELARLQAENAALAVKLSNQALRDGVAAAGDGAAGRDAAGQPAMGVVRGSDGVITVTARDGRVIRIDPKAVSDEDAVQRMVQTALEPPQPPRGRDGPSGADVAVVAVIFPCLIVIMLIVWRIVVTSRRPTPAVGGAVGAELAGRLGRIEQAIEAVAIEVERISESERYSARLLTERLPEPARQAERAAPAAPTAGVVR